MANGKNEHAASGSATGYLYQCRYALLAALKEMRLRPQLSVSIERFDDVAFDEYGTPEEIIQTKHHPPDAGVLTDQSVDLWKTLGIWSNIVLDDAQAPGHLKFVLLTTGEAPEGSAASWLRGSGRAEAKAVKALHRAAQQSRNVATASARESFLKLTDDERMALLNAIEVLDSSPDISDVHDQLCALLHPAAPKGYVEYFVQRLEGWWFAKVIEALKSGNCSIPLTEIEDKIDELREGFSRDALPVDYEDAMTPPQLIDDCDQRPFVQQLRLINVGGLRISYAVRDYYRAFEQRSRWIREELLFDPEVARFDLSLQEAWQPRFAELCDKLTESTTDHEKIRAGQDLFRWAEQDADIPLRSIRRRFLCHGSYHMLADEFKIGWHPEYETIMINKTTTDA